MCGSWENAPGLRVSEQCLQQADTWTRNPDATPPRMHSIHAYTLRAGFSKRKQLYREEHGLRNGAGPFPWAGLHFPGILESGRP